MIGDKIVGDQFASFLAVFEPLDIYNTGTSGNGKEQLAVPYKFLISDIDIEMFIQVLNVAGTQLGDDFLIFVLLCLAS